MLVIRIRLWRVRISENGERELKREKLDALKSESIGGRKKGRREEDSLRTTQLGGFDLSFQRL